VRQSDKEGARERDTHTLSHREDKGRKESVHAQARASRERKREKERERERKRKERARAHASAHENVGRD